MKILTVPWYRTHSTGSKKNGPHEFATFLENIFASEIGFELPRLKTLVREVQADIVQFAMAELRHALKQLRRNKCADSNGIVAECFVHGNLELHEHLLFLLCTRPSQSETLRLRSHRDIGKIKT